MPKCKRKKTLRSEILYAGKPSDLPVSDLPTYRQIIQFYHQIKAQNSDVNKPVYFYSREIEINLIFLWTRVNPRLVLLTNIEKKSGLSLQLLLSSRESLKVSDKRNLPLTTIWTNCLIFLPADVDFLQSFKMTKELSAQGMSEI